MYKHFHKRRGLLAPDKEMWTALKNGELLRTILSDFYAQVYCDATLSAFFHHVTIDRIVDKQYSFLRSIFTGEKSYFGDHPKNAHHWMVISEEQFDYRAVLMERCLRKHGLADHLVQRWLRLENVFRRVIVKDKPVPRKLGNLELPLEGYSPITLDDGNICDECASEMPVGTLGYYHRRTGKLNCKNCHIPAEQY